MPRPHICAACDPPAFRPSPTAGLMSAFGASVYHRLRKAQPCSLREWDGRAWKKLERAKGFEPSTPTLARSCSTPELHPHPVVLAGKAGRQGRSYTHNRTGLATTRCPERSMLAAVPAGFRRLVAGVRVTEAAGAGENGRDAGLEGRI